MSVCCQTLTNEAFAGESVSILTFADFFRGEAVCVGGENAVDIGRGKETWGKVAGTDVGDDRVERSGHEQFEAGGEGGEKGLGGEVSAD